MTLPVKPPVTPMLAKAASEIPRGDGWLYEPKWDGFRAIVFRDDGEIRIDSRNGRTLDRYFPEVVSTIERALPNRCVADGEIVLPHEGGLDFEMLQMRLHPAASRVKKLAAETPASFVAFDMLAQGDDDLRAKPLTERRALLLAALKESDDCFATPQTSDRAEAERWFERFEGAGLDGVIAKRAELPYVPGERVMVKVKHRRTADCVVGGYRVHKDGDGVGSLLLGLYDDDGVFHFVGHTSSFTAKQRRDLLVELAPLVGDDSFGEGRSPGGPSRWSADRDMKWVALRPALVAEVSFEQVQHGRFRHASRLLRWRPDKDPRDCTFEQIESATAVSLEEIRELARRLRPESRPSA